MFISKSPESRKDARKAMKESRILSRYPEFDTVYVSKDPGSNNIVPLPSREASEARKQPDKDAIEVLYDASKPISSMGLPIYICHSSALRPATANAVRVGNRLFFQTVHHAFRDKSSQGDMTTTAMEEDLEIDSDSDSEDDDDNVAPGDNALAASGRNGSLNTVSYPASLQSGRSRSSTFPSSSSTPPPAVASPNRITHTTILDDAAPQSEDTITSINHTTAKLIPFAPDGRNYALKDLVQPSLKALSPLGRLIKESAINDWALIEIIDSRVQKTMDMLWKNGSPQVFAYDKIALCPEHGAEVYTYTASGGRICGTLCATASYTRLPNGTSFREIYVVRLDKSLATGDCGSAIIDAYTGDTYGHLVAGCKTTGTAYVLAAHQTAIEFEDLRVKTTDHEGHAQHSSLESIGQPLARDSSKTGNCQSEVEASDPPPTALRQDGDSVKLNTLVPCPFLAPFPPEHWPREFSRFRKPNDDRPCMDSVIEACQSLGVEPACDEVQLFMDDYDDELTSLDVRNALSFLQDVRSKDLYDQPRFSKRGGTAWLDDRTQNHLSAHEPSRAASQHAQSNLQGSHGIGTRYTRTYHTPLTAHDLHCHLREKRFDHATYSDADRRLVHIADPDAYDFLALVKTASAHQQRSLRNAICDYLASRTSVKATVFKEGSLVFQLEFHLPYFVLRRTQIEQNFSNKMKKHHRAWMNVDFLGIKETHLEKEGVWGVHQAQISLTICGTANSCWIAYCFEGRHFEEDEEMEELESKAFDRSDKIARGELDAHNPIWDPREYYLHVVLIRMQQVHREWEELVRYVEVGIKEQSWGRFFCMTRDGTPLKSNHLADSEFYDAALHLLSKLLEELANTHDAWTNFTSLPGGCDLLFDLRSDPRLRRTISHLNEIFDSMLRMEKRLQRTAEQCEKRAQIVHLHLSSESKKNAEVTVYAIAPVAIVSLFFAIPTPVIDFDRNLFSFLFSILLYVVTLQSLLFVYKGKLRRQPWWERICRRAKAAYIGDPALTVRSGAGVTKLRRRSNHKESG
jgi:hypothetical protein